jgi:UDP-N-acetylglucosamine 3-dehydrogenase
MSMRVGIASFAHLHAEGYAAALGTLERAEFTGVADEDAGRGRAAAERYGVRFFESVEQMAGEADVVIVCSENVHHRRDAVTALENGAHVLCEKPLATTVEDALSMIRATQEAGRRLGTAFPVRYMPAVVQAREIVRAGGVGRVLAVSGTNHGKNPGSWFVDPALSGGGAVMDHTVHVADAIRWIFGVEAKSVYAEVDTFFGAEGIDDAGTLTIEFESPGVPDALFATLDPSWSRNEGYPTWGDLTMRITGTTGVLDVDGLARKLTVYDGKAGNTSWMAVGEDMNALMIEDFLRGIEEGKPAGASGEDGLRALEIALAAYRSGESREPASIERAGA